MSLAFKGVVVTVFGLDLHLKYAVLVCCLVFDNKGHSVGVGMTWLPAVCVDYLFGFLSVSMKGCDLFDFVF